MATEARAAQGPMIVVVGSANVDFVAYIDRVPTAAETVLGRQLAETFGGKGANQAVMASRLGARVAFIGAVGDDAHAARTIANFRAEGVDIDGLAHVAGSSGLASIWVEADGTNRIVVIPGANALVDPAATAAAIDGLTSVDVVIGQLEIPQAATLAAFRAAKRRGAVTILNPAPAGELDPELLLATDWLVPNEVELGQLADAAIARSDPGLAAFGMAAGRGLVVTLGEAGAEIVTDGHAERVPAPDVEAVDTTGAGDAFVGAFAVGLALELAPGDAVRLGIACASDSVTRRGAQASYPDRAAADPILARLRGAS